MSRVIYFCASGSGTKQEYVIFKVNDNCSPDIEVQCIK